MFGRGERGGGGGRKKSEVADAIGKKERNGVENGMWRCERSNIVVIKF